MAYTLTGIKSFRGMEGHGLNATLLHDGRKVAFIMDSGNGGSVDFDFRNPGQNAKSFESTTKENAQREHDEFVAHCRFWYEETGRKAADKAEYGDTFGDSDNGFSMEVWVNAQVDEVLNKKRLDRAAKTKTLYRVPGTEDWFQLSVPWTDSRAFAFLVKKYKGQTIEVYGVGQVAL